MKPVSARRTSESPIRAEVRDQALAWFTLSQSGDISETDLQQLQRWRQSDSEHERAWQRMTGLTDVIKNRAQTLESPVARRALQQTRYVSGDRRQALKILIGAGLLGAVGWQTKDGHWLQSALADLSTATGERRRHRLADGTQLWLNTDSAVDIRFDAHERRILVRYGEVDILTGSDSARRPLLVQTRDALLRPLGTRFTVRCDEVGSGTLLSVSSGRVAASMPGNLAEQIVEAGYQARIARGSISHPSRSTRPALPGSTASSWPSACGWAISWRNWRAIAAVSCAAIHRWPICCLPAPTHWTTANGFSRCSRTACR